MSNLDTLGTNLDTSVVNLDTSGTNLDTSIPKRLKKRDLEYLVLKGCTERFFTIDETSMIVSITKKNE